MKSDDVDIKEESPPAISNETARSGARWQTIVGVACVIYTLLIGVVLLAVRILGDRWWPCTLLMFSARWPWGLPLVVLLPVAAIHRRRSLLVLSLSAVLVVGGILDFRIPWRSWTYAAPSVGSGTSLRVITWNVHRCDGVNVAASSRWLADQHADVIALEEWPKDWPAELLVGEGWHVLHDGELCVASRQDIRRHAPPAFGEAFAEHGAGSRYWLTTPAGDIPFAAMHLASPHPDFHAALHLEADGRERVALNTTRRKAQAAEVAAWAEVVGSRVIIVGDLNTPSDSPLFDGRQKKLSDAFLVAGAGFGYTYTHRGAMARIDHVIFGSEWRCRRCTVGPALGSPHRPVIADLALEPGQPSGQGTALISPSVQRGT